jgi:flagellar biosynthetic protein FlhB
MAEGSDDSQEKTEEPTSRRLEKARDEGQIPRSKELTSSAILISGSIGLFVFGPLMSEHMLNISRFNFSFDREIAFDTAAMLSQLTGSFADGLFMLIPLFVILLIASILGPIALGGWLWSAKAMAPKMNRMDPFAGLKRMFGIKGLVELAKALAKVLVVLPLSILLLSIMQQNLLDLARMDAFSAIVESFRLAGWAGIALAASTILIAIVDIPFQIWDNARKLKMSRQDIKDEMKDTEGKPEVKARIRQLQYEMSNNRQLSAVPEADVVITNPTHYSVALKYDPETMETPILIAKGVDHFALKIREVANKHKIQIIESPILARGIYHTTEPDQEIPGALYMAVAQVLAYVFQLRNFRKGQGEKPEFPNNLDVPKDMQFD